MLNKQEVAVMHCLYENCKKNKNSCIISSHRILQSMPEKYKLNENKIDVIIKQLEYDGYIESTFSEKKGEKVNVVTLKEKGKAFKREIVLRRREIISSVVWKIIYASLGAVVALAVSKILSLF